MSDKNGKSYSPSKGNQDNGGFGKFLWNSDTGEFLGRTGTSWCKYMSCPTLLHSFKLGSRWTEVALGLVTGKMKGPASIVFGIRDKQIKKMAKVVRMEY